MATTTLERPKAEEGKAQPVRYDPWAAWPGMFRRLSTEMDRFFDDFAPGRTWRTGEKDVLWAPQVEVLQKNGQFIVRADLPGLTKDDVKVEVTDEGLTIRGERKQETEEKKEGYYRSERCYGSFYRLVPLPEGVQGDRANASFKNGVLEVTMPAPKEEAKPTRQVPVTD